MSTIAPNPMPELAPLLKRLRLSGILDSLETRNREAVANKIPYTDFLALLIADEVARREHKKFNLRIRRAGFRSSKTLEQFDFDFNPAIDQSLLTELASCRFVAEKVAVLIAGPCGTGKSHIAQALGHAAVRADYDVLFTTQSQLLASLHAARAINAYERRFQTFARVPLLVIDDFGLKPLRATAGRGLPRPRRRALRTRRHRRHLQPRLLRVGRRLPQSTARRRHPRPAPSRRLPPHPGGPELSLSKAHARAPQTNRCHRSKEREIITPSGTPDQHPKVAPLTRTWVAPLGRSATVVGEGERRRRYVVCFNPREAERQRHHRTAVLAELEAELASLRVGSGCGHAKRVCELRASGRYGKYLRVTGTGRAAIDRARVKAAERMCCFSFSLVGSPGNLAGLFR